MDDQLILLVLNFGLIMTRLIGFFLVVPFYGSVQIPPRVKVGLLLFLTILIFPVVSEAGPGEPPAPLEFSLFLLNEVLAGFLLGFIVFITFSSVQLAGQFIDLRMGFALVNVLDPQSGEQIPLAGQLKTIIATLLFLSLQGHHLLLRGIFESFEILALGQAFPILMTGEYIMRVVGNLFYISFMMALPVIAVLFISDIVFGFLARTIPQINMFSVGIPTKILLGIMVFFLALPTFGSYFREIFQTMFGQLYKLVQGIGG